MTCEVVAMPGGGTAIVCSRGRHREKCATCGRPATKLCDWKVRERRSGTCDKPLCNRCATNVAHEKDLCPEHAQTWNARGRPGAPVDAPVQGDMFTEPATAAGGPGTPAGGRDNT